MFSFSPDSGNTWLSSNIRTVDSAGDVGNFNSIHGSGTNLFISYYDATNDQLKVAKSFDSGNSWQPSDISIVTTSGGGQFTSLLSQGPNIFVSHHNASSGTLDFARSGDNGITW